MMMCRIANVTAMSIVIEDLGVRLQPVGGSGSYAMVRADMAARSIDLKRHSAWVKVDEFEIVSPDRKPVPVQAPAISILPPDVSELERLRKTIDDMSARQEKLFELLSIAMAAQPQVLAPSVRAQETSVKISPPPFIEEDTIILLGKIIPDSVEISVQTRERELAREDFDSALEALKKAKGK